MKVLGFRPSLNFISNPLYENKPDELKKHVLYNIDTLIEKELNKLDEHIKNYSFYNVKKISEIIANPNNDEKMKEYINYIQNNSIMELKSLNNRTDEEIEQMEKEIEEEGTTIGQPVLGNGQETGAGQASATGVQPEDNTQERLSTESLTPQLDAEVEKSALGINRK